MSNNQRQFKRQLFGYRRKAVDEHLAVVDASIADLREAVDRAAEPEHHDIVLRATRLAVQDVLQRAHDDAARIIGDAETEAARVLADAYDIVAAREAVIDLRPDAEDEDEAEAPTALDEDRKAEGSTAVDEDPERSPAVDLSQLDLDVGPAVDLSRPSYEVSIDQVPLDRGWNADLAKAIED